MDILRIILALVFLSSVCDAQIVAKHRRKAFQPSSSLLTDLVAWWSMDEASGNRADSHSGGHTLTDTGSVGSATAKQSNGADFEESSSHYLDLSDGSPFDFGDADFTFAFWFNPESTSGTDYIIDHFDNSSEGFFIATTAAGNINFRVYSSGLQVNFTHATSLSNGTWYFVVVYHDSTSNEVGVSLDNGSFLTASCAVGPGDPATNFRIGSRRDNAVNELDGILDEVASWSRLLTSDEITELFNSGSAIPYPGP